MKTNKTKLHPLLHRKFELYIVRGPGCKKHHPIPLRSLKADKIGSLVTVKAIVVRVTDVKPNI